MFNLLYLIALPSLFLLVLCGLYGLELAVLGQKEKALTERQSRDRMQNGNAVPPTKASSLSAQMVD
mgnify:FL=1